MTRATTLVAFFSILVVLSFAASSSLAAQQNPSMPSMPPGTPPAPTTMTEQMTNIPYFSEADGMNSILTLNNNTKTKMPVNVTIFDMDGNAFAVPAITLKASSITNFHMRDLLRRADGRFDSGSIAISYEGNSMGVTAQVGVFDPIARISFESSEIDMMDFMSTQINAVVWIPEPEAQAFLALSNTATNTRHIKYSLGDEKHELNLKPRQTQILDLNEHPKHHDAFGVLLHIEQDGMPGDVIGTGFVYDKANGYSSNFMLIDPMTGQSNHLAGAHLRFGQPSEGEGFPAGTRFKSPLVLANVGAKPTTIQISVDYTKDSKPQNVRVDELRLAPGQTGELDLAEKMADRGVYGPVDDAGVDIGYTGAPGGVIASLTSVDLTGDYAFYVPVKDASDMAHMSGSTYPWNLEDGNRTVLHIKNSTSKTVWAEVQIRFAGGAYNPDRVQLEPFQTVPIDIEKLRASKKKDVAGKVFPKNATSGQISWIEETPKSIIGRAEEVNVAAATARSFSCAGCPCNNNIWGAPWMTPSSFTGPVGGVGYPFSGVYETADCNSYIFGPYSMPSPSYSSTNSSVASVNGSTGQVSCLAGGTATINATMNFTDYYWTGPYDGNECVAEPFQTQTSPGGGMTVQVPDHLVVQSDTTSVICTSNGTVRRDIQYSEVDASGNSVGTISTKEQFASKGANSCNTTINTSETCSPDTGGVLTDHLTVGCNSVGGSCGFTYTKQQWLYCPGTGTPVVFATPGDLVVHNNSVTVSGHSSFSVGTKIFADGTIQ